MLFFILIFLIGILIGIVPFRYLVAKAKTKYYGKSARMKIRVIKKIEPFLNWIDDT